MEYSTLVEIVAAVHLSRYVQSPFDSRSGLFLVAPPGAFKTTITETMDEFQSTQVIADINVQSLVQMKEMFLANQITTLAFSDFAMIYKRHSSTSAHIEGVVMSLADEGFRKPSWARQRGASMPARCAIIGGMTTSFYESKVSEWEDNGFLRRFLFAQYMPDGLDVIEDAIGEWRKAELDGSFIPKIPTARTIKYNLSPDDVTLVRHLMRHQHSRINAFILMQKIFCVLKWKFQKEPDRARSILKDFSPCLGKNGGMLTIRETKKAAKA